MCFAPTPNAARSHESDDPGRPQDRGSLTDVRLRAKADHHQRIRNRVRGIGRSDHGDVNDNCLPAAKAVGRWVPRVDGTLWPQGSCGETRFPR